MECVFNGIKVCKGGTRRKRSRIFLPALQHDTGIIDVWVPRLALI